MNDTRAYEWWQALSPGWKVAFGEVFFGHFNMPDQKELQALLQAKVLRFAGPTAPYPNMRAELTDLSGLAAITGLEILVVIHHQIRDLAPLKGLKNLNSLFLNSNQIESIQEIRGLTNLEMLYVQENRIQSIKPVEDLLNLRELYVNHNDISSLEGITEEHSEKLLHFFCHPNPKLPQKELLRIEREKGVRCRSISGH